MKRSLNRVGLALVAVTLFGLAATTLCGKSQPQNEGPRPARSRAEEMLDRWNDIGNKLVAMALDFPEADLREKMWTAFSVGLEFTQREVALLVDLSEGFSGSDIHEVCVRLRRRQITKQQHPEFKDAFQVLQNANIKICRDLRILRNHFRGGDVEQALRNRFAKVRVGGGDE